MARTKETAVRSKRNATATPPLKEAPPTKSPTQPQELSEADRAQMKTWLDRTERPFSVTIAPLSRKRKRGAAMQIQDDLYEPRLSVQYEVKPKDKWECLRRYKRFTVGSESIAVGQEILVKHDDFESAKIDVAAQWKARVLEVRALDPEHVFIRVSWLNRPEDLDSGRQPYHGRHELIPTNQMDIIDALTTNGSLEVVHWDDNDEEAPLVEEDQYFWRQTYDFVNTRSFSALRKLCIDDAPQNPDELILQCGNPECKKWQHLRCIAEAAAKQAADDASGAKKSPAKKARPKTLSVGARSLAQAKAQALFFTAEVFVEGLPKSDGLIPSEKTEVIITDGEGEKSTQPVCCLFCGHEID